MSTQPKFTPGPHAVGGMQQNLRVSGIRIHDSANVTTAIVIAGGGRADATASLYAAAPDLYAALEQLRSLREQWRNDDRYSSLDYMDAIDALPWESALAKARGEASQ